MVVPAVDQLLLMEQVLDQLVKEIVVGKAGQTYEIARLIEAESKNLQSATEGTLSRAREAGAEISAETRSLLAASDSTLKKMALATDEE